MKSKGENESEEGEMKGKDSKRWQRAIIGILLVLIMVGSVIALLTHSTTGSDVTQTTVRNGYTVNPDNVTISMDSNTTSVLIGQNVQFMCEGNKTGPVTIRGIAGTPTEGCVFSSSTGWFDTSVMTEEGLYNATYEDLWELLAVSTPVMDLRFKVDGYEVNSITVGAPLGIHFTSNLDENDCVDLLIIDPVGMELKQNPADPNQKFDDINVSTLLEYGSENESKRINTSGWKVGTYTFSVRTEEENARGLDVYSHEIKLDVYKCEISINADKTQVVKSEKVKLTIAGCLYHNITINSSDPQHTIFPAGYEDNLPYDTSGFDDIIDSPDAKKEYVVYFNNTGTYTITVTDTTADAYDSVDIKVTGNISFDVPSTCIIGRKLPIKGVVNTGNSVDIAIDDIIKAVDVPIENNTFYTEISTEGFSPGTITIKGFIDGNYSLDENVKGKPYDGLTAVLMIEAHLNASISKSTVSPGDSFEVYGNASSDYVEIVAISPKGGNGTGMDGLYGVSIYTVPTFKWNPCSYEIDVWIPVNLPEHTGNLTIGEHLIINDSMRNKEDEGIPIIIIAPGITANLSTNLTHPGGSFVINGTATGTEHVDIITISPKGGDGTGLYEKSYPGVPGITNESIPVDENYTFSKTINVSENADIGEYVIWISVPGRDGVYGTWSAANSVDNASELIKHIIDDYCDRDINNLCSKTQEQILDILKDATIVAVGSDDLALVMELTVGHPTYNFYRKIKVDSGADMGNYTIIVLSPGVDGVYGNSSYKYIDNILDLDVAGPELGAIDVSNKTQEEITSIIKNVTIDQAGSDDLFWTGYLTVYQPKIIYVDDDFEDDPINHSWNTVQEGINDANDGDTVIVYNGTYYECVVVNKTLSLLGEGMPKINAQDSGSAIKIIADSCVVKGFRCISNDPLLGSAGIEVSDSAGNILEENVCENNTFGIFLSNCSNTWILNNTLHSNSMLDIYLLESSNNIASNNALLSGHAIRLKHSQHNMISSNVCEGRHKGLGYGIWLSGYSFNNTLLNNICKGYENGVHLWHVSNNTIYLNNFINNTKNVYSYNSTNTWNSTEKITYIYNGTTYENYTGNYWSDYTGSDANGDGIGDTPYIVDGDKDNYPMIEPFENYFAPTENIFDTGPSPNPYPSIFGTHNGTITLNQTITVSKLYTYPCPGTGGHSEYVGIYNETRTIVEANWTGYSGEWHNITFPEISLEAGKTYNYTIRTGSYPQIHHTPALQTANGWINCTEFIDANNKRYNDWIPAIRLWAE